MLSKDLLDQIKNAKTLNEARTVIEDIDNKRSKLVEDGILKNFNEIIRTQISLIAIEDPEADIIKSLEHISRRNDRDENSDKQLSDYARILSLETDIEILFSIIIDLLALIKKPEVEKAFEHLEAD